MTRLREYTLRKGDDYVGRKSPKKIMIRSLLIYLSCLLFFVILSFITNRWSFFYAALPTVILIAAVTHFQQRRSHE